jgi:23S rRNA-/tRNA-specific pseudouridylate synthase
VLYRDENIVVVDKPHFLATMPRGSHVAQTVVVRLRRELGLPELTAAHRLDRLTAGVLLATVRREVRAPYQEMFARREYIGGLPGIPLRQGAAGARPENAVRNRRERGGHDV